MIVCILVEYRLGTSISGGTQPVLCVRFFSYKAGRYLPHRAAIRDAGTSPGVVVWLPSGSENRFGPAKGMNINMSRHALMPQVGS